MTGLILNRWTMNKSLLNANPIMNMDILPNPALKLKQLCNNMVIRNNGKHKREREAWVDQVRFPLVPLLFSWPHVPLLPLPLPREGEISQSPTIIDMSPFQIQRTY
jgi:hypothetical protein